MDTFMLILFIVGVILFIGLFVIRNDKRPEGCTCEVYNDLHCGPVNNCPVHKHFME